MDRTELFELLRDRAASSSDAITDAFCINTGDAGVGGKWASVSHLEGLRDETPKGDDGGVTNEASLPSEIPVAVVSVDPLSENSDGSEMGTKYSVGSDGSEVVSLVAMGLRAHFGNGGNGASGGIGKWRTGGDTTWRNVALKYNGRIDVGFGLIHLRCKTMKNNFSRDT